MFAGLVAFAALVDDGGVLNVCVLSLNSVVVIVSYLRLGGFVVFGVCAALYVCYLLVVWFWCFGFVLFSAEGWVGWLFCMLIVWCGLVGG